MFVLTLNKNGVKRLGALAVCAALLAGTVYGVSRYSQVQSAAALFSPEGEFLGALPLTGWWDSVVRLSDGRAAIGGRGDDGYSLRPVDFKSKGFGTDISLPGSTSRQSLPRMSLSRNALQERDGNRPARQSSSSISTS